MLGKNLPFLLTVGTFVISVAATFAAWNVANQEDVRLSETEFRFEVRQAVRRIEQRMTTYEGVARSAQAYLLGSVKVRREDFSLFVASLRLQQKFPGIQGIALVELVHPRGMAEHVIAMRRQSFADFVVTPAGERQVYSSIIQIEPFTGLNLRALGFDMLTESNRRAAMERARDTGSAAASGKLRLIQENGKDVQS
ncbi:CHASE domain-containing protein, partial [Massilia sp. CMS3.1]|uniref:CHASE domain-containing protein n=1 Tax=Massilia sp. CMS3.1 TaxID=3373083 RepID=UPI003EE671DB